MSEAPSFRPAGAVLAGGRSSRLGSQSKALAVLGGVPLVRRVLRALQGQADPVVISVQDRQSGLDDLGLPLVTDLVQRHRGPLTGLCSAMQWLADRGGGEWLLLCPCDAPFLPPDLAGRLHEGARTAGRPVAVASYADVVQPTFSLWNLRVFDAVRAAVMEQGRGGLMQALRELPHAVVPWQEQDIPPFFNVNTRADLAQAAELLRRVNTPA